MTGVESAHSSQLTSSLYIIIPAYNESENISQVINDWYPVVSRHNANGLSRLVIIDDGSKDNTFELLQNFSREKNLLVTFTKPNSGHGATLITGYNYAIEHGAEYIFQTDSDGQTLPEEFEAFWSNRQEYDAVIGNRPNRGDGASRKFVEKVLCLILKIIFGVSVPDSNAPFRLMKRDLLAKYLARLPKDFNLPNVMLTSYFVYFREKVKFMNITFRPRQGGTNSINIKRIVKIGLKAVKDFIMLRRNLNAK